MAGEICEKEKCLYRSNKSYKNCGTCGGLYDEPLTTDKAPVAKLQCSEGVIKPCPFCGSDSIDMWPMKGFKSPVCMCCGATICENIMTGPDTEKQIAAWNKRAL